MPNARVYSRTAQYGRGQGQWFQGTKGIAFASGRAYLFDTGRGRVTVLDDALQHVQSFGREGRGPGEIAPDAHLPFLQRYWTQRFIDTDGSRVTLYDRAELQLHGADGELLWQRRWPDDSDMISYGVRSVGLLEGGSVLVLVDSVDFAGSKPRRLQVWSVSNGDEPPVLRAEREIRVPATDRTLARQARPFMESSGSCVVTIDGAEPYLHVVNVETGVTDSLRLPDYEVPSLQSEEAEGVTLPPRAGRPDRAAAARQPIRWTDLAIDPDGTAWVKKWAPFGSQAVEVIAIDLTNGSWTEHSLPAFPRAFVRPGVFLAIESDPDTDEQLVAMYVLDR